MLRIFPNDESALRLIGALLAEQNEAWQERKYLDMEEFKEWAAARTAAGEGNNVVCCPRKLKAIRLWSDRRKFTADFGLDSPRRPRRMRLRRNSVQNGSASLGPTFIPSTWRWPSVLTPTATITATLTMRLAWRVLT
jgi:hypothetical protein